MRDFSRSLVDFSVDFMIRVLLDMSVYFSVRVSFDMSVDFSVLVAVDCLLVGLQLVGRTGNV
jgi:hypothetical protein